jgi:hypothetical protein
MKDAAYRIRNWHNFQHYKNRNPPWIKLHKTILDDPDYAALPNEAAKYLPLIWLVASDSQDGSLPAINKLAFRLRVSSAKCEEIIKHLSAWVCNDASDVLADRSQDATPETETEERKETETKKIAFGEFNNVKLTQAEYDKLESKHGRFRLKAGIDLLGDYMKSKGKTYKDHYAALKESSWVWERIAAKQGAQPQKTLVVT